MSIPPTNLPASQPVVAFGEQTQPGDDRADRRAEQMAQRREMLKDLDTLLNTFDSRRQGITPFMDAIDEYSRSRSDEGFIMSTGQRRRLKMFKQELSHQQSLQELRDYAVDFAAATTTMTKNTKSFWRGVIRAFSKRIDQLQKQEIQSERNPGSSPWYRFK